MDAPIDDEMAKRVEKLVESASRMGTLPEIYQRIDKAVSDPSSSLDDIARVLTDDPPLAARLLKIANSSLYGFPSPITTITRALTVIGTRQLRDLVMATSVINLFPRETGSALKISAFWKHSIACGLAARVIATYRREANVERYYVMGLLHDIGQLVIALELPNRAAQVFGRCREEGVLLHDVEREVFGFDHAHVGGALLASWKLPVDLSQPVTHHHYPGHSDAYAMETAVVHVADIVAMGIPLEGTPQLCIPPISPEAWNQVGLPVSILRYVFKQVENQYMDAVQVFLAENQ